MKRFFLISTCVLLCLGCKQQKEKIEEPDYESLRKDVKPTEVVVATAEFRPFEFLVNATGTIESDYELEIIFETSGYLKELNIENGQRVTKGQVIGQLENENEKIALEKAEVAYRKATFQFKDDSLGRSTFNEEMLDNLALSAGVVDAEINLRQAKMNLENTIVKAPSSGVIVDLSIKEGSLVSAGKVLCSIYDPNNLTLTADVLETNFGFLKPGLIADVFPLSQRNQSYAARIGEINPRVSEKGMIQVQLNLNQTNGLLPGMNANAIVRVPQQEHIIVPREAVVIKQGKSVIFTVENGVAQWKYVEIGLDNGVDVEVLDGLKGGESVILTNNIQLAHDARVTVTSESLTTSKQ